MIGRQHLITRTKGQRPGHNVQGESGIGHVNQIISVDVQIAAQDLPRLCQQLRQLVDDKLDRLQLQATLPLLISGKDGLWRRTKRAVIKEVNVGIEEKQFFQGFLACSYAIYLLAGDSLESDKIPSRKERRRRSL